MIPAPDLLIFACSLLGFAFLAASMDRHAKQIFGRVPASAARRCRAVGGGLALALALAPALDAYGLSTGIAVWLGFHALAATMVGLALAYRPRVLHFIVPGMSGKHEH